ncbi:hypothetical protein Avbf_18496 [Armadillidium vulgare]|nr:hypothetical protein Avbf_18496 [Armadillidium vulgare]
MIRSLKSNWKQAVSFYFSDITPAKKLKHMIFDILKQLKNSGLTYNPRSSWYLHLLKIYKKYASEILH